MNIKRISVALLVLAALLGIHAAGAAPFSTPTHDAYPGDFTGDGKSDLLVIAKDPSAQSGIYATDASGQPSTLLQSWSTGYLGINWDSSRYTAVVGNFDGVNGDDVLLQRNGTGSSFLLPSNAQGQLYGISQYINGWGTDAYHIVAGNFDGGNTRDDVFLQARQASGTSSVILSNSAGQLTVTNQTWANNHLGFKWSVANAVVHVGDFNGDGRDDLFLQSKGEIVLIDYEIPIPVTVFKPYSFGLLLATTAGQFTSPHQIFSRKDFGVDFSPSEVDIVVGKFNSDGRADLLLLARRAGQPSFMVPANANGQLEAGSVVTIAAGTLGAELRTLVADFNGDGRSEVYRLASTSSGSNSIVSFTSSGSIAASVTHNPAALPSSATIRAGRMPGEASVSRTGAGEYEIPLRVLPGINGLQPALTLQYRSQRENGLLGMGFAITGFSVITRCNKNIDQDGSTLPVAGLSSDAYCLDDERLRLESGLYGGNASIYRTEVESYSKIEAVGFTPTGPASFAVHRRDGLIYEYGMTTNSRVEYVGSTTIRAWALNGIRDRAGNRIDFSYIEDTARSSYRPSTISYTANPAAGAAAALSINFVYESADRPDPVVLVDSSEFKRLARIEMRHLGVVVRQYLLSYAVPASAASRSRLGSIQECANTATECLAATQLTWTNGVASFQPLQDPSQPLPGGPDSTHLIDVNADARDDLVYVSSATSGAGTWRIRLANASGDLQPAIDTGIANTNFTRAMSLDWDGDRRIDLLVPFANNRWYVLRSNGTGFDTPIDTGVAVIAGEFVRVFDLDGDGREDLVRLSSSGPATVFARYRNAAGFGAEVTVWVSALGQLKFNQGFIDRPYYFKYRSRVRKADFDSDGREDFIAYLEDTDPEGGGTVTYYGVFLAGQFIGQLDTFADLGGNHLWADLNGDRATDIIWISNTSQVRATVSAGSSFVTLGPTSATFLAQTATVLDFDSDGRDDLLMRNGPAGSTLSVLRSTGSNVAPPVATDLSASLAMHVADFDGNGVADLASLTNGLTYRRHVGTTAELLDRVTDGYGSFTDFDYVRLAESSATYSPGAPTAYPIATFPGPMTVVATQTSSNGIGGTFARTYRYEQAREHLLGRGFLGFGKRTVTDNRTGISVEESYLQDPAEYQTIGQVSAIRVRQPSGALISEQINTWSKFTFSSGFTQRRYPYVSSQVTHQYEVNGPFNGQLLDTATTTSIYDSVSGVATDVTTTTVEGSNANGLNPGQSHTVRTYVSDVFNDTANWCLGRPNTAQQINSHTLAGGTQLTRTAGITWDGPKCRPTQQAIEPGNTQWQVTTSIEYDNFGNPKVITATPAAGQGQDPRVTQFSWGTDGRFPRSLTNAKSQVTQFGWNEALGLRSSVTDPNNLVTSWQYDVFGRMTRQQRADGTATDVTLGLCNSNCGSSELRSYVNVTARDTGNNSIRTDSQYLDALDRIRFAKQVLLNGAISTIETRYDALGRVSMESTPYVQGSDPTWFTTYVYDLVNRTTQVQRPTSEADASTHLTQFSYEGLTARTTDALGRVTTDKFSVAGQVLQRIDALGSDTDYEYDAFGQLLKTRDVANNEITLSYNVRGFRITSNDPDLGAWSHNYFPFGEIKSQTNANNQVVSFTYDALSRLLTRTEPEGVTNFTFDTATKGIGRLASVSSPGGYSESYSYDSLGRLSQHNIVADAVTYTFNQTYNALGLLDTVTYPTSTASTRFKVRYGYANGLQQSVRDFTNDVAGTMFWQGTTTNASGRLTDEQFGNGIRTLSNFDRITGQLKGRTAGAGGGTSLQNLAYTFNKVGALTQRQDLRQSLTEAFTYDALDRLDFSTLNGVVNLDMAYNAIGNITSKSDVGSYTYHPTKKHAVASAGSIAFTYDANGNAITRNGQSITWTSYDLPSLINGGSNNSSAFSYGPDRQRWKQQASYAGTQVTTLYLGGLLEKVTLGGVTSWRHHVLGGNGEVAIHTRKSAGATETHYLSKDHLGSTDVISDGAGNAEVRLSFSAFGQRRNAAGWTGNPTATDWSEITDSTRHGYTGHEMLDNLNLTHMNGRVYDQVVGRFLSADPIVQAPFDSQSFNRYSYVFNSPLNFTDPNGFQAAPGPDDAPGPGTNPFTLKFGIFGGGPSGGSFVRSSHPNQRLVNVGAPGVLPTQGEASTVGGVREFGGFLAFKLRSALSDTAKGTALAVLETIVDFTPIVGDIKGFAEAFDNPTAVNIIAAAVGLVPFAGDVAKKLLKTDAGRRLIEVTGQGAAGRLALKIFAPAFSPGRETLLGAFDDDFIKLAQARGANYFEVPDFIYSKFLNQTFLDKIIASRGDVVLSRAADTARKGGVLEWEIMYLLGKGYELSADGLRLTFKK